MTSSPILTVPSASALSVNGQSISLGASSSPGNSAIDTGTTLIAAPLSVATALYAAIPSSSPGSGKYDGYFYYPCATQVNLTLTFGGVNWSIQPSDFEAFQISDDQCVGAVFAINSTGSNGPDWIIGDAFLVCTFHFLRYRYTGILIR
jgi:cathepsin D